MKNKTALFVSLGILLLVLIGGFVVIKNLTKAPPPPAPEEEKKTELPQVDASVKVDLIAKAGANSVTLSVTNIPEGTDSIEYELSYLTGEGLPKGALGKIDLKGNTEITRDILLGTCSRNTCTYDQGVKSVKLVLRFNSATGASQFSKEYPLGEE